jgi:hypothetical protein
MVQNDYQTRSNFCGVGIHKQSGAGHGGRGQVLALLDAGWLVLPEQVVSAYIESECDGEALAYLVSSFALIAWKDQELWSSSKCLMRGPVRTADSGRKIRNTRC